MFAVPVGQPAAAVDGAQTPFGGLVGGAGGDDEKLVALVQAGVGVGDEGGAVADDQIDGGRRWQP